jgi:hypothetical protein
MSTAVMSSDRSAARVVDALTAEGLLTPESAAQARAVVADALGTGEMEAQPGPAMPKLVEVVAYLGAALVLAAGFLFVVRTWDDLGDVGQVSFLAAVALVLALAGAVTVPPRAGSARAADVRRRLSGTLLAGSSLAAGFAVGVAIEVFTDDAFHDVYWPGVAGGFVVAVGAAVAYRFSSTAVGLVAMIGGALDVGLEIGSSLATTPSLEPLGVGVAAFSIGAAWVLLTELGLFDQVVVARALGVAATIFGAQVTSFTDHWSWCGYLLSVVIAVVGAWLYLTRLAWPYLAGAVIAVTLVVPEAVTDWTGNSLGVVGGVLVAGITLLLASFAGYRLRKEAAD